jgi:hypothetical protein
MGNDQNVSSFTSSGLNLFAGTFLARGIYISTNNGGDWVISSLQNTDIYSLLTVGTNIFAGTFYGVYLSTNFGVNWNLVNSGLTNLAVYALVSNGTNIFAGTGGGVFRSTNNGGNWTVINNGLKVLNIYSMTFTGTNLFAGTWTGEVYRTTNNGGNWDSCGFLESTALCLNSSSGIIFAGTWGHGIYRSTDNGISWSIINNGLTNQYVRAIAINGSNLFAGTYSGIFLSTNSGENWINKNQGFIIYHSIHSLYITNNFIFAGTDSNSVWRRSLSEILGVKQISSEIPSVFFLHQNYPNPFNPTTTIRYDIPKNSFVKLVVYDALGREVETLVDEKQTAGTYEATFNASQYSSGVYFYRLTTDNFSETKKMLLIK